VFTLCHGVFWLSLAVLAYTFAGYPLLMRFLARRHNDAVTPSKSAHPTPSPGEPVTIVLCVHNEATRIVARLENLLDSNYPRQMFSVLVASDGSTDNTPRLAAAVDPARVTVLVLTEHRGKAAALNAALAACTTSLAVLADTRQRFTPDTIARLAAHFADPNVGAVSGALDVAAATSATGTGIDTYWRLEKRLRADEAVVDSCIGCTGAVYALRRELFTPLPEDTVLDDLVIPMQIAARGHRILFDSTATAHDPQPLEPAAEQVRKGRTLAGNFQMLFRYPQWLTPLGHRLWWQLLSHKYLRLAAPACLLAAALANLGLAHLPFYRATLAGQAALYTLACIGLFVPPLRAKMFVIPAGFVFLNLMTVRAFWLYLTHPQLHRWSAPRP
jgi:cellulose synthase/poly-beta-1,6-N-acetylglucosamine synthase-like glycosyltransferase